MVDIIVYAAIAIGLGLLPAVIARGRGKSFIVWWIYGAVLFPVALGHLYLRGNAGEIVSCPYCRNPISTNAQFCRRCGYDFFKS